jgi:hypothetical protein
MQRRLTAGVAGWLNEFIISALHNNKMVDFTPWPLYLREKLATTHRTGAGVDPTARLDISEKKNVLTCAGNLTMIHSVL